MKTMLLTIPLFCFSLLAAQTYGGENEMPILKETFKDDFFVGAAIAGPSLEGKTQSILALVASQFSSISPCNALKWGPLNPEPGVFRHELADTYVEFGRENDMYVVGHVLFWHNQTPQWVYQDESGQQLERRELLERMRERVRHVSKRYGNKIDAWDVVNESMLDNGGPRDSLWTKIVGKDFIEQAFRIAAEELPADVELIYNDYLMTRKDKRDAVAEMVLELKQKNVRIDGVGIQGHWSVNRPSIADIEASIAAFSKAGVDVHITELDIDVLPRRDGMWDADVARRFDKDDTMDPYRNGLPEDVQQKLAQRYADLFRLFLKHKDKVKRVTFWGTTDKHSWLNNWPIRGRTSHPLLFDRDARPKPAFHAVTGLKDIEANNSIQATPKGAPDG